MRQGQGRDGRRRRRGVKGHPEFDPLATRRIDPPFDWLLMVQAALTERVVHRVHRRYLWIPVGEPRIGFALRSCQRRLSQSGCFDQSRAAFLTQPVAVAPDGDDLAVVQQPVEYRRRHYRIAKHAAPLANCAVAGDQHRAALVAPRDQLEEQMRGVGLEQQIAEFVDNQQLGLGEEAEPPLGMRRGERRGQLRLVWLSFRRYAPNEGFGENHAKITQNTGPHIGKVFLLDAGCDYRRSVRKAW